jgi:hypothetical protein
MGRLCERWDAGCRFARGASTVQRWFRPLGGIDRGASSRNRVTMGSAGCAVRPRGFAHGMERGLRPNGTAQSGANLRRVAEMSANGSGGCPEVGSIGLERLWDCARVLPRSRLLALSGSRLPQSGSPTTRADAKVKRGGLAVRSGTTSSFRRGEGRRCGVAWIGGAGRTQPERRSRSATKAMKSEARCEGSLARLVRAEGRRGYHPGAAPQQAAGFERQQAAAVRVSDDSGGV